MNVLCLHGSPRKKGNSEYLLSVFSKAMEHLGHEVTTMTAARMKINHCIGCGNCETKGVCIFTDDFSDVFLPAFSRADMVVIGSPVYFYGFPSVLKILIDRIQVVWSRKYLLKTDDYKGRFRKGVLLAIAATRGKDLFDGLELSARYFLDAADVDYCDHLFFRGVDEKGQMEKHPEVEKEIQQLIDRLGV